MNLQLRVLVFIASLITLAILANVHVIGGETPLLIGCGVYMAVVFPALRRKQ
jgi:hypothetical protein